MTSVVIYLLDLIMIIVAVSWTFIIIGHLISTWKDYARWSLFKYTGKRLSFFSVSIAHICFGLAIWGTTLYHIRPRTFLIFMGFGALFALLSLAFLNFIGNKVK